jgi:hypothetical protein
MRLTTSLENSTFKNSTFRMRECFKVM